MARHGTKAWGCRRQRLSRCRVWPTDATPRSAPRSPVRGQRPAAAAGHIRLPPRFRPPHSGTPQGGTQPRCWAVSGTPSSPSVSSPPAPAHQPVPNADPDPGAPCGLSPRRRGTCSAADQAPWPLISKEIVSPPLRARSPPPCRAPTGPRAHFRTFSERQACPAAQELKEKPKDKSTRIRGRDRMWMWIKGGCGLRSRGI